MIATLAITQNCPQKTLPPEHCQVMRAENWWDQWCSALVMLRELVFVGNDVGNDDVGNDVGHDVKDVIHNITSPFNNEFHKGLFGHY
jgi:hypothetical protein